MNLSIFRNLYEFVQCFFTFLKIPSKNLDYKGETVSSISQRTLEIDMESCYKNLYEIRNVAFIIFKNFRPKFQSREKNWKIFPPIC